MTTSILVLGGTGTVGSRIARQLPALSNSTVLIASRNKNNSTTTPPPQPPRSSKVEHVTFDWHDPSTWSNPFSSSSSSAPSVRAVYLIAPPTFDADSLMMSFIDFARDRGVRRFVLQSASPIEAGGPVMGKVHAYLRELGQRGEVEWGVLRPSWFQGAFFIFFLPT
jgi:nucleoside-diphosphate-sugar epimerase